MTVQGMRRLDDAIDRDSNTSRQLRETLRAAQSQLYNNLSERRAELTLTCSNLDMLQLECGHLAHRPAWWGSSC